MAFRTYKCKDCNYKETYLQQPAVDGGTTNPAPDNCPKCDSENYDKDFISNVQNISFDVPGGYDYEYGKKSVVSGMAGEEAQADAMYKASMGESPY